jgi:hypothetical protein
MKTGDARAADRGLRSNPKKASFYPDFKNGQSGSGRFRASFAIVSMRPITG